MSGDPIDCRERASHCMHLADVARTPELRATFDNLAEHWLKLAVELERESALGPRRPYQRMLYAE